MDDFYTYRYMRGSTVHYCTVLYHNGMDEGGGLFHIFFGSSLLFSVFFLFFLLSALDDVTSLDQSFSTPSTLPHSTWCVCVCMYALTYCVGMCM